MSKTILIDIDGTVAWWEKKFISLMSEHAPHLKTIPLGERTIDDAWYLRELSKRPEVKFILKQPGFYRDLEPIEGAVEVITRLIEDGHNVWFCTAPSLTNVWSATEKLQWVSEHYGSELAQRVIITPNKNMVMGDFLIDDMIHSVTEDTTWKQIYFTQSYNAHVDTPLRLGSWDYDKLQELIK